VTMSRVWLLDPTTILVNPSYKKRWRNLKFCGGCKSAML
jgi:hypothetical protein